MKKPAILYIDDETVNLMAFEAQFRRKFDVYCVNTVQRAFECLDAKPIDFVFSDQRMPKLSGTEFLSQVMERYPAVNRGIISGFIDDASIKNGLQSGVAEIAFEKPYTVREIEEYIYRKRQDALPVNS